MDYKDIPDVPMSQVEPFYTNPDAEESLADMLAAILRRLDVLESHFTFQGLDVLTIAIEQRMVTRLRNKIHAPI